MIIPFIKLSDIGYYREINTLGATECKYYEGYDINLGHIFIKIGEKVEKEIQNYLIDISSSINIFLPILAIIGSNGIVLPFANKNNYGFNEVDAIWNSEIHLPKFIDFQKKAFNILNTISFYRKNSIFFSKSNMFINRLEERISALGHLKDNLIFCDKNLEISIGELLYSKIPYYDGEKWITLPPLEKMIDNLFSSLNKGYEWQPRTIHGDFQASNIVCLGDKLYVSDISDIRHNEDISWDMAKWINYLSKFHLIVKHRNSATTFKIANIKFLKESLREKIVFEAINSICSKNSDINPEKFLQRVVLGEFSVNISTLKRHYLKFPNSVPIVIKAIAENYISCIKLLGIK